MAHADIDCHMDFFTLLGLTKSTGEEANTHDCSMNVDLPASTSTTTTTAATDLLQNQSGGGGLHAQCYRQPQAFAYSDCLTPDDKENKGLVNGFHVTGNSLNKGGFLQCTTTECRGMKRFYESGESNFLYGQEATYNTLSKRQCLEENGYMSHVAVPDGDLPNIGVPLPPAPDNCAEMTSEPAVIDAAPASTTSLCSQCGKKKHKKYCTGYVEEMMYCSQMSSSSASLMPCSQCLSGQSGHLEHITAARMDMS